MIAEAVGAVVMVEVALLTVTLTVADGTITGNVGSGITVGGTPTARTFAGSTTDLNTYFTTAGKITYTTALDNNTVDMEVERTQFAANTLKYEAASRALTGSIKTMQSAISGQ